MKILVKVLFVALCASLLFSCAKDEALLEDEGDLLLKKGSKKGQVTTVVVEPTGIDDTENLKNAFTDAKAAGPGSVIQLCEGEYSIDFLEVRDFYGTLKGAGKGKTIVTAKTGLDAVALWDKNLWHDLIKFVGGDVHLCHFTIQTPEGKLCATGHPAGHLRGLMNFSANNAQHELGNINRAINVVIDNVSFNGQYFEEGFGYYANRFNCLFGVRTGWDCRSGADLPREKIDIKITNSEFNELCYGVLLEAMNESMAIVGEKNKGNIFRNNDKAGGLYECRDTKLSMEGNTFNIPDVCHGFDVDDYPYYGILKEEEEIKSSLANIQFNVFDMAQSKNALRFYNKRWYNNEAEKPVAFQVRNNKFTMRDGYGTGVRSIATKGMVIRNNKFSGHGFIGIVDNHSTNALVLGNNFSTAKFENATIILWKFANNWTIVGGNVGQDVIVKGENNLITGMNVNMSDVPLGQTIVDNLQEMKSSMHDLK